MDWQTVLGFEIHVELATVSKMFCPCPADHFGAVPNSRTCPVCLGLPGALPVPNRLAIEWTVKLGLALDCQINRISKFDRKNYFYPDLPKGYQISQYDQPFCHGGRITLSSGKIIRITRVHLEEDTGKLQHAELDGEKVSLVDFNRSGVPLVEIVTEPDFDNLDEAGEFLKEIQAIVRELGISSADMEKGSMRLEANVSVRPAGDANLPDYKVEIKNVNSFRFIKKAVEYDVSRQIGILESGRTPDQETRGWSEKRGETVSQRSKEAAHDYRYFPEPDIPPLELSRDQIEDWRSDLPLLPARKRSDLQALGLTPSAASVIVASPARYARFRQLTEGHSDPKAVADLIINTPEDRVAGVTLDSRPVLTDESAIRSQAEKIVADNPAVVADIRSGKIQAKYYLIGQLKRSLGEIDIKAAERIIDDLTG